jgi:hypothetical protein
MIRQQIGTGYFALVQSAASSPAARAVVKEAFKKAFAAPVKLSHPVRVEESPGGCDSPETAPEKPFTEQPG